MLDMSAAFDIVDHRILLNKLKLYGFDDWSVQWVNNYLTGRSQSVLIDGAMSPFIEITVGVPQGSILGPLFYILYTNDLPEITIDHENGQHLHEHHFTTHCGQCGGICCFADDSTLSISKETYEKLEDSLSEKYSIIAEHLVNNRLKMNDDKTNLLIMKTDKKDRHINSTCVIRTQNGTISPKKSEKLLGITIQDNLKWAEYIQNSDKSLLKQLNLRLNALKIIGSIASFKVRLMVANGVFMSKLVYQISLWGGCAEYLLDSLQVVQNKAARFVARKGRYTHIKELLTNCGWLSVRQLVFFHSVMLLHKVVRSGYPEYIYNRINIDYPYHTRLAASKAMRLTAVNQVRLQVASRSFIPRACKSYNRIPADLRQSQSIRQFRSQLKIWVRDNVNV